MSLESILVVTDLSPGEGAAVQRAAQLAAQHDARLRFAYLPLRPNKGGAATPASLAPAARRLQEALQLHAPIAPVAVAQQLDDIAPHARGADLLVLPHRRDRSTAAFFRGQPVARLLRQCATPVLVTRDAPQAAYRRILVAADFSPASETLVQLAASLEPRAELEIFHAICTRTEAMLRSAEATDEAIRAWRERCLRHARDRMLALTDSFDARRNRFLSTIDRGDPGRQVVVQQERSGADLVVVGKRTAGAWADFFCGSVAHRVLSWGTSDVLVVPQAYVEAAQPVAAGPGQRGAGAVLGMG